MPALPACAPAAAAGMMLSATASQDKNMARATIPPRRMADLQQRLLALALGFRGTTTAHIWRQKAVRLD